MTVSDNYFSGKVAVITGGSRGIGRAVAEALVSRGCKVVIGDVLDQVGQETVNELNTRAAGVKAAAYIHTDVTVYKDVLALFKFAESEFGGVDIAFLNAGVINKPDYMFSPLDDEAEKLLPEVNISGVVKCTRVAMLAMAKRGGGVITVTASCAGFLGPFAQSIYNATKHAVVGWTRSLGMLKDICNVRVNAVCPHWVETDMRHKITKKGEVVVDPYPAFVQQSPTVKIDTVVSGVLSLMEDESRNTETLLTLPPNILRVQEPIQPFPEQSNPAYDQLAEQYEKDALVYYKSLLGPALKKYEQA
ncbi:hypothetical protein BDB00DRAFT_875112 [Zychaea mexicana]|uniref:uncharacterized protein n=1 Tax=Zychaea mexicana TaxID=64656 RepID=UPI0022FDE39D|nr:uncharacterized protein BDB00DRAFT_875112 [Zychaea mexicana]KAI9490650.1 hypothetical protein BDB00DRAFT_875112 [Zychaea mexicana]